MTYATVEELGTLSGSYLDDTTLQALLDDADRKIKGRLAVAEVSAPSSDDLLKSACISLAKAGVYNRIRLDGANTGPPQYDWSHRELNDTISAHETEAWACVDGYILTVTSSRYRWNIRKVNS